MSKEFASLTAGKQLDTREHEALRQFRHALQGGEAWFPSLLDAIGQWTVPEETFGGRHYRYLVGGEAFDWLLLAERISLSVDGLIPDDERNALLFSGEPPEVMSEEEFGRRIGPQKHMAMMNYWYGVRMEEALIMAVEYELQKALRSMGKPDGAGLDERVCERIYGKSKTELLIEYYEEQNKPVPGSVSLTDAQEFTYWLFKRRLKTCDKERVASDTKKGLAFYRRVMRESQRGR